MLQLFSRGKIDARAVPCFELAAYTPGLRPDDMAIVVTDSDRPSATLRALERARRAGMETVCVTGFPESREAALASHTLPTGYAREAPWAHPARYTAALSALATLANALADPAERLDLTPLPEAVRDALSLEGMAHRVAASVLTAAREGPLQLAFIGGGPNQATAREAQFAVLATGSFPTYAFELEQALHGPLAAMDARTLIVVVAPPGPSSERVAELARAALLRGIVPLALVGEENAGSFEQCHRLLLPSGVPEVVSPITAIVPLQLLSYFLAVGRGLNPDDSWREDEL